jgi:hypothetical protein
LNEVTGNVVAVVVVVANSIMTSRFHVVIGVLMIAAFVNSATWTLNNRLRTSLRPRDLTTEADPDPVWRSFRWAPSEINVEDLLEQLRLEASRNRMDAIRQTRATDRSSPTRVWPPPWISDLQERSRHRYSTTSRKQPSVQPCAVQSRPVAPSDAEPQNLPVRDVLLGDAY